MYLLLFCHGKILNEKLSGCQFAHLKALWRICEVYVKQDHLIAIVIPPESCILAAGSII